MYPLMHVHVYPVIASVHEPCTQGLEWQNEFWAETESRALFY